MYHEGGTTVVNKRMSFLSVAVLSCSAILITAIAAVSGLGIYAMRLVDRKCDSVAGLLGQTIQQLPEFREALPPALADAIDDVRRPDYLDEIAVETRLLRKTERGYQHATLVVTNRGDEVISLLSMRVIGLDAEGAPIAERSAWVATPIQIEDEWRGPLLPRETRRIPVRYFWNADVASVTHEITEIRTWRGAPSAEMSMAASKP